MSAPAIVTINTGEKFPHLKKAPIVEAVIDLRARAESDWQEHKISEKLKSMLPDYPKMLSMSGFQQQVTVIPGLAPEGKTIEKGWTGVHCESENGLQIAQFTRDGFMFARLHPYEEWERLVDEAQRLWKLFLDLAKPTEIQRIGIRFINRINLAAPVPIQDYLDPAPQRATELDLPVRHFFHQDVFDVTGHPYAIMLTRTTQEGQGVDPQSFGIILDIDVYTTQPFEIEPDMLERRLSEMRWLKNKMFFGSIASKALEAFK